MELLSQERKALDREYKPAGYNMGVNVGPAAGQSIFHVHIHLIRGYPGDSFHPQGGVRQVIPEKADYVRI